MLLVDLRRLRVISPIEATFSESLNLDTYYRLWSISCEHVVWFLW